MKLAFDVSRCTGREVPFGSTYDNPECKSCARAQQTEHGERQPWCGPIKFTDNCPSKIRSETE